MSSEEESSPASATAAVPPVAVPAAHRLPAVPSSPAHHQPHLALHSAVHAAAFANFGTGPALVSGAGVAVAGGGGISGAGSGSAVSSGSGSQSLLKTAVSCLGPVKVKRTRQRVDAGEPRNSYASIANFSSTRAAARAQQQLHQQSQPHSNFHFSSHHLTHHHYLSQHSALQQDSNKRARVENIVYNMMQVTGPAASAGDHSALLSSTSPRNSINSLSSLLGSAAAAAHPKSGSILSSSPKSLVMQSAAAASAAGPASSDHLMNGFAKEVTSNTGGGGHNLRSSGKSSSASQSQQQAAVAAAGEAVSAAHSLPSSATAAAATVTISGRQSVSSDRCSSSCSSSNDEAAGDHQNQDDVTPAVVVVAVDDEDTGGEDEEKDGTAVVAASADETKPDQDERSPANDQTTGQSPSKSVSEKTAEAGSPSPKSESGSKDVSHADAVNESQKQEQPASRQVNGCKKRKLYQPQQTTAKVMQNGSTEEEEDELLDDEDLEEEDEELLSMAEDEEEIEKMEEERQQERSDEEEEDEDVASDLSVGKKSASDRLQMFGMRKRYMDQQMGISGEKHSLPINLSTATAAAAALPASGQMTQSQIDQQEQEDMIDADMIEKDESGGGAGIAASPAASTGSMGSNDEDLLITHSHHRHHQHSRPSHTHKRFRVDDQHLNRRSSSQQREGGSRMDAGMSALKAELLENVVKAIEITFEYARRNGFGTAAAAAPTTALLPSSGLTAHQLHAAATGGVKRHHESDQSPKEQSVGLLARMLESKGPSAASNASSRIGGASLRTDDRSKCVSAQEAKTSTPNGNVYGQHQQSHHAHHGHQESGSGKSAHHNYQHNFNQMSASAFPGAPAGFKNPFPHFLSPMAQNFSSLASALNSRSAGSGNGLESTRSELLSPCNSVGECDSGEALSLVLTPKRKRSKVTDTRMTPRTVSRLLGSDPALMNLFARGDLTSSPPPSLATNGHGIRQSSTSPSAPPPPLVPVSLPTSVAIPNPSLHHHHHDNHVSSLFSTGAPAFPFTDSRFLFSQQQAAAAAAAAAALHRERDEDRDHEHHHHSHHRVDSAAAQHQLNLVRAEQRARAADQALKESQMKEQAAKLQEQQQQQMKEQQHHANSAAMAQAVSNALAAHHLSMLAAANQRGSPDSLQGYGSGMFTKMGSDNGADVSEDTSVNESSLYDSSSIPLTSTLTPMHLRKAKLMFFYVRYPSSAVLKMFFPDIKFNKNNTAQLVKWFSNFREFYYIQMEKYARQAVGEGISRADEIEVPVDAELIRVLNLHYNRNNHIEVPEHFRFVVENTLREFFKSIVAGKDSEQSWKKAIYKIIARLDDNVPEYFKSPTFLDQLE